MDFISLSLSLYIYICISINQSIYLLRESLDKLNEKIKMYKRQLEEQESISNSNIMRVKKFQRELESAESRYLVFAIFPPKLAKIFPPKVLLHTLSFYVYKCSFQMGKMFFSLFLILTLCQVRVRVFKVLCRVKLKGKKTFPSSYLFF